MYLSTAASVFSFTYQSGNKIIFQVIQSKSSEHYLFPPSTLTKLKNVASFIYKFLTHSFR